MLLNPIPTRNTIRQKPKFTPNRWGKLFLTPKFKPDVSNIMLLGPGVMAAARQNIARETRYWISITMMLQNTEDLPVMVSSGDIGTISTQYVY
jgi:hypothetical protein